MHNKVIKNRTEAEKPVQKKKKKHQERYFNTQKIDLNARFKSAHMSIRVDSAQRS